MKVINVEVIEKSLEKAEEELRFLKGVLKEPYPLEIATQIAEKEGQIYILTKLINFAVVREIPDTDKRTVDYQI